jgi:5-methylcytosine-specific restriction endonuclease McrA
MPKPNPKCIDCSKVNWRDKTKKAPKCYNPDRCKRKRAYYRRWDYYKAKQREAHRYLKYSDTKCLLCNNTSDLEVHHILPQSKGGTDDWTNLVTLCYACHKTITAYYRRLGWDRDEIV